jgi:nicotinate-nucleotide adenylyltransferase
MRIGLFGGTFDPIHWGHLRSAEEVREGFALDRILFIPTAIPPHKRGQTKTSARDRLAMVRLALASNPNVGVSTVEINRPGISYSIDTLRYFAERNRRDHTYYFILGLDAFREISSWKDFRRVFPLCNFIVTSRPGSRKTNLLSGVSVAVQKLFCYDSGSKTYRHRSGTTLHFLQLTDFAVSASDIRARVRQTKSIRYLVPKTVQDYIGRQRLYSEPAQENNSIG